jgi:hypothetical protein
MDAIDIMGFWCLLVLAFCVGAIWGMDLSRSLHRLMKNEKWDGHKKAQESQKTVRFAQDAEWDVLPIRHRLTKFAHLTNPHFLS